jgi:hypothetical protein
MNQQMVVLSLGWVVALSVTTWYALGRIVSEASAQSGALIVGMLAGGLLLRELTST